MNRVSANRKTRIRQMAAVGVLAVTGAACSTAAADSGDSFVVPDVVPAQQLAAVSAALPLTELARLVELDEQEHWQVEEAIRTCMASKGFEYGLAPFSGSDLVDLDRRYGIIDPVEAANLDARPSGGSQHSDEGENVGHVGAAWDEAFFGVGTRYIDLGDGGVERSVGGCLEAGQRTVVGDVDAWTEAFYRVQFLLGETYVAAESDPRVVAVVAEWSACMRDAGYAVRSLEDLGRVQGDDLMVTNATCNNAVGLASTWIEVEGEYQRAAIDGGAAVRFGELLEAIGWGGELVDLVL